MNFLKENMTMNYNETEEFIRDFKKRLKKFPSLTNDLETAKKHVIELFHVRKIDNRSTFKIKSIGNTEELQFYKIKKFACKSLKGRGVRSGIRIIYAFFPNQQKVVFIEIYFKAQQENETRQRMIDFVNANNYGK